MRLMKVANLQDKWPSRRYIEVYVKLKSAIKHVGNNVVFHMTLCDDSGEIRANIFNFSCDRYYDMMQINKKYRITDGHLKNSDRKYTNIPHNHVIYFTNSTVVTECQDDDTSPIAIEYNFIPINEIQDTTSGTFLDVIGVIKDIGDLQRFGNKTKRIVILTDESGGEVNLALWNKEAVDFDVSKDSYSVVLLKDARVTEFNYTITLEKGDYLFLDPDIPRAHELKYWYLTTLEKWVSIYDVMYARSSESICLGTILEVFAYSHVYKACLHCNTKLENPEKDLYKCDKCNKYTKEFKKWLVLKVKIADPTGELNVSAFSDVAEKMLGKNTEEICSLALDDDDAYSRLLEDLRFKSFVFQLKRKHEEATVINVRPMNCKEVATRIIASTRANKYDTI